MYSILESVQWLTTNLDAESTSNLCHLRFSSLTQLIIKDKVTILTNSIKWLLEDYHGQGNDQNSGDGLLSAT